MIHHRFPCLSCLQSIATNLAIGKEDSQSGDESPHSKSRLTRQRFDHLPREFHMTAHVRQLSAD